MSTINFRPDITTQGLVLYIDAGNKRSYPTTGTTAFDVSGSDNNGSLIDGVGYSNNNGGYFTFDGVDDYIGLGKSFIDSGEIGSGNISYTLESWFYLLGTPGGATSGYSLIGNASASGIGMQVMDSSGIKVNFGYRSTNNFNSISSLSLNTWYHVVCTREVGVNNRIYINGVLDQTFGISQLTVQDTSGEMQIGFAATRIVGRFHGYISIAKLYNTYLTDSQVLQNFEALRGRYGI